MINKLVREYFKIIEYLNQHKCCKNILDEIIVDKKLLMAILKQDTYLKAREKLKLYKTLNLIKTETGHYTLKRVLEGESKRCIVFNKKTLITLEFYKESIIAFEVMEDK